MKLYKIRNWNSYYENSRSRDVKDLDWVKIPNHHDGENYTKIITHPEGAKIFSAWVLAVEVSSKCRPRGTLLRSDGTPHTSSSLSLKTRAPKEWFDLALDFLENNTDWLEIEIIPEQIPQTAVELPPYCQPPDVNLPKKGREGKGREEKEREAACSLLGYLNLLTGKEFREVDSNLSLIKARLKEPGVTSDGITRMIERQCELWKDDPKMSQYLRPETLFGKSKFDSYYAAKDLPITSQPSKNQRNAAMGKTQQDDYETGQKNLAIIAKRNAKKISEAKNGSQPKA